MSDIAVLLTIALGTAIAVVYPGLYRYIRKEFPPEAGPLVPSWLKKLLLKYGALFAFSLITALIALAFYRNANPDAKITFWGALVIGFGWEASVEKVLFPKTTSKVSTSNSEVGPPKPVAPKEGGQGS